MRYFLVEKNNRYREISTVTIIFIICLFVYLINGRTLGSGDTVPNSILAFNLLENHTLNFDNLRGTYLQEYGGGYFFINSIQGELTSLYPIGTAILTFPLYLIFYLYLKIYSTPVDLTSHDFEYYRLLFEKLAATLITAITVIFFYLSSRLKFDRKTSLISTLIYAFATNAWTTNSQGLWQHGAINLCLIISIYYLLKANRDRLKNDILPLIIAGFFAGLLPGIRPTSALFTMAALVYSLLNFRLKSVWFILGLTSVFPSIIWNLYNFNNLVGGYSKLFQNSDGKLYLINLEYFINTGFGLLFSPSRGLFFFSPILIFSLFGAYILFKSRFARDEKLIGLMIIAAIFIFINYSFYIIWWGGHCYGPRFLTDILPIVCYLINYSIVNYKKSIVKQIILGSIVILSVYPQAVGAFGDTGFYWNPYPLEIDHYPERVWQIKDNQIQRHSNSVFHKVFPPPVKNPKYIQEFSGSIEDVRVINNLKDTKGRSLNSFDSFDSNSVSLIKANLKNQGKSTWFGYKDALSIGETRIAVIFYDDRDTKYQESRLFVSDKTKQDRETTALASIKFPDRPGKYKMVFSFIVEGIAYIPKKSANSIYELNVAVN